MADKFKALVHYICHRASDDPGRLGATKLHKVLWYSDARAFRQLGRQITETRYIREERGPVAKSLKVVLRKLDDERAVVSRKRMLASGVYQHEFVSLSEPDISDFSGQEIAIVDLVMDWVCNTHTARSISELTHDAIWEMHKPGDEIPLYLAHMIGGPGEIKSDDVMWALGYT